MCSVPVSPSAFAEAQNFKYEEFHVELEGDLDPDGFLGRADVKKGLQEIRFTMHFKTEESQESCERFADFVQSTWLETTKSTSLDLGRKR